MNEREQVHKRKRKTAACSIGLDNNADAILKKAYARFAYDPDYLSWLFLQFVMAWCPQLLDYNFNYNYSTVVRFLVWTCSRSFIDFKRLIHVACLWAPISAAQWINDSSTKTIHLRKISKLKIMNTISPLKAMNSCMIDLNLSFSSSTVIVKSFYH